jgi:DNA modification methylase
LGQRNQTHPIYPELYTVNRHRAVTRRKIAKRMKFKNYKDVLANATKVQKEEFEKKVKKLLKEIPYEPKKKKCIGNAWFIPYTPTSKLSKQIGIEEGHNYRKNSRADHPATFPEKLSEQCIKLSGIKKGSLVYDPFVGTGTTLVSAKKLGMIGIGTEINDSYIQFSKKRINKLN